MTKRNAASNSCEVVSSERQFSGRFAAAALCIIPGVESRGACDAAALRAEVGSARPDRRVGRRGTGAKGGCVFWIRCRTGTAATYPAAHRRNPPGASASRRATSLDAPWSPSPGDVSAVVVFEPQLTLPPQSGPAHCLAGRSQTVVTELYQPAHRRLQPS
jgi:hypothetical protein